MLCGNPSWGDVSLVQPVRSTVSLPVAAETGIGQSSIQTSRFADSCRAAEVFLSKHLCHEATQNGAVHLRSHAVTGIRKRARDKRLVGSSALGFHAGV